MTDAIIAAVLFLLAEVVQLLNIQIMKGVLKVVAWLTETKDKSQSPNRKIPNKESPDGS